MVKRKKKKLKIESFFRKHKRIILISFVVIFCVFLLSIIISQTYLKLNYLLGNDVLIDLNIDKDAIIFSGYESENISLKASVNTNPFCQARCTLTFNDLANEEEIDREDFILQATHDFKKKYIIQPEHGMVSKLYAFELHCLSNKTFWCNTKEEIKSRKIILDVKHILTKEQNEKKKKSKKNLDNLILLNENNILHYFFIEDNSVLLYNKVKLSAFDYLLSEINHTSEIYNIIKEYESEYYQKAFNQTTKLDENLQNIQDNIISYEVVMNNTINDYNEILKNVLEYPIILNDTKQYLVNNINKTEEKLLFVIKSMNNTIDIFNEYNVLDVKKESYEETSQHILNFFKFLIDNHHGKINLDKLKIDNFYNFTCMHAKICNTINMTKKYDNDEFCKIIDTVYQINKTLDSIVNITEMNSNGTKIPSLPKKCRNLSVNMTLKEVNKKKIVVNNSAFNDGFSSNLNIIEPYEKCCFMHECKKCMKASTGNNIDKDIVIFLHGHAFNEKTPVDYSLDALDDLQEMLEKNDDIINFGRISLYDYPDLSLNLWGKYNLSLSIKASYYFDMYKDKDTNIIVSTKNENIDTYALRFKDVVDIVSKVTASDNITIVAHSMGGLVTRRYLQIFGSEKVDKVIFITVPHHGTYGRISDLCSVFGEELECRDMKSGSLFLKKLNSQNLPEIPITNVIGVGCSHENGESGDGIVLEKSAYLKDTNNIYVNGSCSSFDKLHNEILETDKYPITYEILSDVLQ